MSDLDGQSEVNQVEDVTASGPRNRLARFVTSPLHGRYPRPMCITADWVASAGIVLYAVSAFALPWMTVGLKDVLGLEKTLGIKSPRESFGLFASPWVWLTVVVMAAVLAGLWFVQTRGWVAIGAGAFCLLFNVVFFIGAWMKINGIIGDVISLARSVPFIGDMLGELIRELTKGMLDVRVSIGFWLFIPAGLLLIAGGLLRLRARAGEVTG